MTGIIYTTHSHTDINAYKHTHTHMHALAHAHTHTHTHMSIYTHIIQIIYKFVLKHISFYDKIFRSG